MTELTLPTDLATELATELATDLATDFEAVLRHCALASAQRVAYSRELTVDGSKSSLKYYDRSDLPIGDDREYDVLKSCFNRLDNLMEILTKRLIEEQPPDTNISVVKLRIDLDLVSGQMSVTVGDR